MSSQNGESEENNSETAFWPQKLNTDEIRLK